MLQRDAVHKKWTCEVGGNARGTKTYEEHKHLLYYMEKELGNYLKTNINLDI